MIDTYAKTTSATGPKTNDELKEWVRKFYYPPTAELWDAIIDRLAPVPSEPKTWPNELEKAFQPAPAPEPDFLKEGQKIAAAFHDFGTNKGIAAARSLYQQGIEAGKASR